MCSYCVCKGILYSYRVLESTVCSHCVCTGIQCVPTVFFSTVFSTVLRFFVCLISNYSLVFRRRRVLYHTFSSILNDIYFYNKAVLFMVA